MSIIIYLILELKYSMYNRKRVNKLPRYNNTNFHFLVICLKFQLQKHVPLHIAKIIFILLFYAYCRTYLQFLISTCKTERTRSKFTFYNVSQNEAPIVVPRFVTQYMPSSIHLFISYTTYILYFVLVQKKIFSKDIMQAFKYQQSWP